MQGVPKYHDRDGGVLVLSEMVGASYELHEALCVNPFDRGHRPCHAGGAHHATRRAAQAQRAH